MQRHRAISNALRIMRTFPLATIGVAMLLLAVAAVTYTRIFHAPPPGSVPALLKATTPPSSAAERPTTVITFAQGCFDSGCHASMASAPIMHAPTALSACDQCHAPDSGGHRYPLIRTGAQLCTSCHDQATHWGSHAGTKENSCLECHNPHASTTQALLRADSTQASCNTCHQSSHERLKHAPFEAGACNACHNVHADLSMPASGSDEQCASCHAPIVAEASHASHGHRSLSGGCIACHDPHAAANPKLLPASTRESCGSCHKQAADSTTNASLSHNRVLKDASCVKCHAVHGSNNTAMLRHSQNTVCLECHATPIVALSGRTIESIANLAGGGHDPHAAITQGECSACHSMHGASHAAAVKLVNQQVPLGGFDLANYALCFSCHDTALTKSWAATQFRDGQMNLHELHLTRGGDLDRSRACSACHALHESQQPRLIATSVNFEGSGWKMPMKFTLTQEGGTCGSSCHEPMTYSRRPGGAKALPQGAPQ